MSSAVGTRARALAARAPSHWAYSSSASGRPPVPPPAAAVAASQHVRQPPPHHHSRPASPVRGGRGGASTPRPPAQHAAPRGSTGAAPAGGAPVGRGGGAAGRGGRGGAAGRGGFRPRPRLDVSPIRLPSKAAPGADGSGARPAPAAQAPRAAAAGATHRDDGDGDVRTPDIITAADLSLDDSDLADLIEPAEAGKPFRQLKKTFPKAKDAPRPPPKKSALAIDTANHTRRRMRQEIATEEPAGRRGLEASQRLAALTGEAVEEGVEEEELEAEDVDAELVLRRGRVIEAVEEEEELFDEEELDKATVVAETTGAASEDGAPAGRAGLRYVGPYKDVVEIAPLGPDPEDQLRRLSADEVAQLRLQRDVSGINDRVLRRLREHPGDPAELFERYDAFADAEVTDDDGGAQELQDGEDAALLADVDKLLAQREATDLSSDEERALLEYRLRHGLSHARAVHRLRDGKYMLDIVDLPVSDDEVRQRMQESADDEFDSDDEEEELSPERRKFATALMLPEESAMLDAMEAEEDELADAVEFDEQLQTREKRSRIKGMMRRKLRDELDGNQRQITEEDIRLAHGRSLRHFSKLRRLRPEAPVPTSMSAAIAREHARLYKDMGLQPRHVTRNRRTAAQNELAELAIIDEPIQTLLVPTLDELAIENLTLFYRKTERGQSDPTLSRLFETVLDHGPERMATLDSGRAGGAASQGGDDDAKGSVVANPAEIPVSETAKTLSGYVPVTEADIVVPESEKRATLYSPEEKQALERLQMRALVQAAMEDEYVRDKFLTPVDTIMSMPDVDSERDNYMFQFPQDHQVDYSVDRFKREMPGMHQETLDSLHDAHLVLSRNPFWSPKQKLWVMQTLARCSEQTVAGVAVNPDDPTDTDLPRNLLRTPTNYMQRMPVNKWKRSMYDVLLQSRRSIFPAPDGPEAPEEPPRPAEKPAAGKAAAAPAKAAKAGKAAAAKA